MRNIIVADDFPVRVIYEARSGDVMILINLRRRRRKRPTADPSAGIWLRDPPPRPAPARASAGISTFPPLFPKGTFRKQKPWNAKMADLLKGDKSAAGRARRFRVILIRAN